MTTIMQSQVFFFISSVYSKQYKEHAGEINALAKKLKGEWKSIQHKARPVTKK